MSWTSSGLILLHCSLVRGVVCFPTFDILSKFSFFRNEIQPSAFRARRLKREPGKNFVGRSVGGSENISSHLRARRRNFHFVSPRRCPSTRGKLLRGLRRSLTQPYRGLDTSLRPFHLYLLQMASNLQSNGFSIRLEFPSGSSYSQEISKLVLLYHL